MRALRRMVERKDEGPRSKLAAALACSRSRRLARRERRLAGATPRLQTEGLSCTECSEALRCGERPDLHDVRGEREGEGAGGGVQPAAGRGQHGLLLPAGGEGRDQDRGRRVRRLLGRRRDGAGAIAALAALGAIAFARRRRRV